MLNEDIFSKEDEHNGFIIHQSYSVTQRVSISAYITLVKLKKAFRRLSPQEFTEINLSFFRKLRPKKRFEIDLQNLVMRMNDAADQLLIKCLYVCLTEGVYSSVLYLLGITKDTIPIKTAQQYLLFPAKLGNASLNSF